MNQFILRANGSGGTNPRIPTLIDTHQLTEYADERHNQMLVVLGSMPQRQDVQSVRAEVQELARKIAAVEIPALDLDPLLKSGRTIVERLETEVATSR